MTVHEVAPGVGSKTTLDYGRHARWTGDPDHEPGRAYAGDAGYDLIVSESVVVPLFGCADVPVGVSIQWPAGIWGFMVGRSSTFRKHGLMVNPAVIDNGYRGGLFAVCRNLTDRDVKVEAGWRIAQIIPMPLLANRITMHHVEALDPSDRGTAGWGSSGD